MKNKQLYLKFHLWENVKYKNVLPATRGDNVPHAQSTATCQPLCKLHTASAFSSFLYHFRNALYVLF